MFACRLLMAVLIRHHGLSQVMQALVNSNPTMNSIPPSVHQHHQPFNRIVQRCIAEICRLTHQARRILIKVKTMLAVRYG